MNAVQFPEMLSLNQTNVVIDKEATTQNLIALLHSYKGTMFGDPYFGVSLRRLIYESNNDILRDLVIDDIFTAIGKFMPQIRVLRDDIQVTADQNTIRVDIRAQNLLDFNFNTYSINLLNVEELQ